MVEEDVDENAGKADEDKIYFEANGYILGKQVLVRADHHKFTSDQIIRHEIGHDKIAKGEIDVDSVRARLVEIVGEENVDLLAENYALAYAASNYDEAQIWEECICDSLGDMNIFATSSEAAEIMAIATPEIKKAIKETSKGANQTRGSPQVEGKASIDIGTNNTDGGITNVRGEETVPDAGNVESGRRVGEKDASGKGSNREHIERKIQEILRKQTVERRDNGFDGRGTARIEKKEAAEAFEDRVQSEGYMYAVFRKTAIAYKLAPKSAWNENAKVAAEHLESFGISVVVFDGNMLSNKSGITQELSSGVTVGLGDLLTVFISSELDIDGMETTYHEAFHALRRMNKGATRHYKIIDIISDGVNVESEAFEKFVSFINELYSYEVADVPSLIRARITAN